MKVIAGDPKPGPDHTLLRALRNAHRWAEMLMAGTSLADIATGTQPVELTLETFVRSRLPLAFEDQKRMFACR